MWSASSLMRGGEGGRELKMKRNLILCWVSVYLIFCLFMFVRRRGVWRGGWKQRNYKIFKYFVGFSKEFPVFWKGKYFYKKSVFLNNISYYIFRNERVLHFFFLLKFYEARDNDDLLVKYFQKVWIFNEITS